MPRLKLLQRYMNMLLHMQSLPLTLASELKCASEKKTEKSGSDNGDKEIDAKIVLQCTTQFHQKNSVMSTRFDQMEVKVDGASVRQLQTSLLILDESFLRCSKMDELNHTD